MKRIKNWFQNDKTLVLLDQAVFSATTFASNILLAHLLDIKLFGLYSSIVIGIYLLVSVTNALVINPFQVSAARIEDKKQYTAFNFWFQSLFIAVIVLLLFFVSFLPFAVVLIYQSYLLAIILLVSGFLYYDFFRKHLLAVQKIKQVFVLDSVTSFFQVVILLSFFLTQEQSFNRVLLLFSLSYLPSFFLGLYFLNPFTIQLNTWFTYFKLHLAQGKWLLMTSFIQWWSSNLFVISSGIFISIEALGAFRLVQSLFGVLNLLLQTFENYFLPKAAHLYTISKLESMAYIKSLTKSIAPFFLVVLFFVFLFSTQLITLAGGEKYSQYDFVVQGMSLLYLFIFLSVPIRMAIRTLILNKYFFLGYVFSFLFAVISFKFLLSTYGVSGAIIGLISSQIILIIFWQYILHKNNFFIWK